MTNITIRGNLLMKFEFDTQFLRAMDKYLDKKYTQYGGEDAFHIKFGNKTTGFISDSTILKIVLKVINIIQHRDDELIMSRSTKLHLITSFINNYY